MKVISDSINKAMVTLELPSVEISLDHPKDESYGDYSSNAALVLSKQVGKPPRELAEKLADTLRADEELMRLVEKIEVAGAGFINFTLKPEILWAQMSQISEDQWEKPLTGKKYAVEYTDPNPFKEFHIGHLYSNLIGESIARLFEANGATVWRGDFYGDVGMHIAKSVWGMMKKMAEEEVTLQVLEKLGNKERQAFMGQGYAMGTVSYDEDPQAKEEIKDINYMVYVAAQEFNEEERGWKPIIDYKQYIKGNEEKYPQVRDVYQAGLKWSLNYFETYYKRLGTKFDGYYPESWVGELGLQVVEKGLKMGVLVKGEEGAVVYEGEQDGLHTRVFRNKFGLPTYEAKDLGLVKAKYGEFAFDYSLNVFGKEIDEYYKVVKKALEKIEPELGKKQEHLAHGMVNLPTGKMGSRHGNVITVEWLLNEARDQAKKLIKNESIDEARKNEIAELVGQGAVKYALLKSNVGDNVTFDFGQSVTFEGASGPYLQYTHARCKSVISKSVSQRVSGSVSQLTLEETAIVRWVGRYPESVVQAANDKSPSSLAMYLYELAQRFNTFYNKHQILGSEDEGTRLELTRATAAVLKRGLAVLGISAPEAM